MALWFETAVCFDKIMENGAVKKVTEKNLFDSLSFAEAEARTIEELTPYISGEFTVKTAKKTKIMEIFNLGAEKYYLCNVGFMALDEKTGIEKRSVMQYLVGASDFKEAYDNLVDGFKDTMADYEIVGIVESPILEVFPAKLAGSEEND